MYRQLYSSSQEQFELLNKSAESFFAIVQHTLLHSTQLLLCKLNDPARSGDKENMTLCALQQLLNLGETDISRKIEVALKRFSATCEQMKKLRNKQIAHFDKKTILDGNLIGPTLEEIDGALARLRNVMNYISIYYDSCGSDYEGFVISRGSDALLESLRRGLRYNELVANKAISRNDYYKRFPEPFGSENRAKNRQKSMLSLSTKKI